MPEKLRLLGESIKNCAALAESPSKDFITAHEGVRACYNDANNTANRIVNSIDELSTEYNCEGELINIVAKNVCGLLSGIYKISGNINQHEFFKSTFSDLSTVNATVNALNECGDKVRATLRKYGY